MQNIKTFEGVKRPTRMLSGVTIVAVMTRPYPCPHGRCIYCPGGPEFGTPQSYIGSEPALMRGIQVNFDPYEQVCLRLKQYEALGHVPSKIEVIIMGGTFTAMPVDYQVSFVASVFEAFNRYPDPRPASLPSLDEAHLRNESARIRVVGLTIETRPDWAKEKQIDFMLYLGATKVELGVQSIYNDVLNLVSRGHTVEDVVEATRLLKDAGYKVVYHVMPGLPGSNLDRDIAMIREIFENPDYRPDMLKIYPVVVVEGTRLYELWRAGMYTALTDDDAVELVSEFYRYIPRWVRVMRIQRDIPAPLIVAGPKKANLRELIEERAIEKGIKISEIRYREVGRQLLYRGRKLGRVSITREYYEASRGMEIFLAVEDTENDIIVGLLRLRIPSEKAHRREICSRTALVRELHIYGPQVPIEARIDDAWQHKGWGAELMSVAEEIARYEFSCNTVYVLSGVGAREYYRKLGYRRLNGAPYMAKELTSSL
ncbi:MAG: tRNA uridine(34) 5-carboxymethylaminomethyl modification radical SAM/GNAT enzyme Elp3 [Ignisphaera sp.]|nr:tRNA uridine(34) 5-carboxymethylaminomethyl modification radical SAM/GNAT enzyme Elp3 [Ignisphaera sp.]MCX8167916.1 tRNA uridine(34) 5-carboxymethylaminomethyl modification radical SAM/GNAT enzyme Elp3 [Ignisphaera sp.]MDW8085731.1 tRNA uridine(34) 5-carboxymethylaminomethyl modification radical SAM/GNAT enzyme Elp3 [Ignisphaera sp.]